MKKDSNKIDRNNEIYEDGENVNNVFGILYKTLSKTKDHHGLVTEI